MLVDKTFKALETRKRCSLTAALSLPTSGHASANVVEQNPFGLEKLSAVEAAVKLQVDLLQGRAYGQTCAESSPS